MSTKYPELIHVPEDTDEVSCNGCGGDMGHPVVFYSFGMRREVTCGYCDRHFVKDVS